MEPAVIRTILIAAAVALASASAQAQGWQSEWDKTVAAAKAEGELVIIQSGNPGRRQWLLERWAKDHPDIKLSVTMMRSNQLTQRLKVERSADKYLWDLSMGGPNGLYEAARQGFLDPLRHEFLLPEVNDEKVWGGWETAFYDTEKKYVMAVLNDFQAIWYNAKLVSPDKVRRLGLQTLFDPEVKGRIAWQDPRQAGPGSLHALFLYRTLGEAEFRRFILEQKPTFFTAGDAAAEAMVREKAVLYLGPQLIDRLRPFVQAGIKIEVRPLGNTPDVGMVGSDGITLSVFNKRPHSNATRLFVNWLLSKQVAGEIARVQQMNSRRTDVPSVSGPGLAADPAKTYFNPQREEAEPEMAKVQTLLRDLVP
jgi:ABC-type glycerol-3-phosphate transport system substrate-binding protein